MNRKRKWPVIFIWWSIFICLVAGVCYLSFQNGEDAKALGKELIAAIAQRRYAGQEITQKMMDTLTYELRQIGRVVAFVLIGIVGTITIHVSCRRDSWLWQTVITALLLAGIAYLTERLKIYIPTRHYSYEEMLLSLAAVIFGFSVVTVFSLVFRLLRRFFRLILVNE